MMNINKIHTHEEIRDIESFKKFTLKPLLLP